MPTKFSGSFFKQFDLAMKLRREELKKQGKSQMEVSGIREEDLVEAFGISKDQMVRAAEILAKDKMTEKSGDSSLWLPKGYGPESYNKDVDIGKKEVLFIQTGSTKGMVLKIKVNDSVFSSLFDTGAQVSCIKYDTVSALGLLYQISDSNTCIRTANWQDMV